MLRLAVIGCVIAWKAASQTMGASIISAAWARTMPACWGRASKGGGGPFSDPCSMIVG